MYLNDKTALIFVLFIFSSIYAGVDERSPMVNMTDQAIIRRNAAEIFYLQGKEAERSGDTALALQSYTQAWKYDTASEFLTDYTAEFALRSGEPAQAIYIISGGKEPITLSDDKLRFIGKIYITYRYYADALKVYREFDSLTVDDSLILSNLLAENSLYREAAGYLEKLAEPDDSLQQIRIADLYRRAGDGEKAVDLFRKLHEKHPLDRAVQKGLGLSLLAFGNEKEAMEHLIWFLPVSGGIPDLQVVELTGRYYASKGRYSDAVQLFQFLYKNDGSSRDFFYGRPLAVYSFLDGRFQYARNLMVQLLKTNSDDYELHYLLGSVFEALKDSESALASYNQALQINDEFDEALRARILLLARTHKVEESLVFAMEYTQKKQESLDAWALYGSLLTMQKRFKDALFPLNQAIKLSADKPEISILFELAMALERTGDIRKAEKVFSDILERDSSHAASANYLGYMWAEDNKKLVKAEALILKALEQDPENGAYLDSYGWVLYQRGNYADALAPLEKALAVINDDYVIFYHLGSVLEKLKRYEDALQNFKKANEFDNPLKEKISAKIHKLEKLLAEDKSRGTLSP